jgi:hypothetical protein
MDWSRTLNWFKSGILSSRKIGIKMETRDMTPRSDQRKSPLTTRMHAFRKVFSCRGIYCNTSFSPKRKDQVFCSPTCRAKYFSVARAMGLILLEKSKTDQKLKVIADGLLEILKASN